MRAAMDDSVQRMASTVRETAFVASLEARARDIVAQCSRCGRCVEVCPTAGPAEVDRRDPQAVVTQVLDLLRGAGDPASAGPVGPRRAPAPARAARRATTGSIPASCSPSTRVRLNERRTEEERRATGQKAFHTMSRGVKVLSRLQLPAEVVGRVTRAARARAGPRPRGRDVPRLQRAEDPAHRPALPRGARPAGHALYCVRRSGQLLRRSPVPRRRHGHRRPRGWEHGGGVRRHRSPARPDLVPHVQYPARRDRDAGHESGLRPRACRAVHCRSTGAFAPTLHPSRCRSGWPCTSIQECPA